MKNKIIEDVLVCFGLEKKLTDDEFDLLLKHFKRTDLTARSLEEYLLVHRTDVQKYVYCESISIDDLIAILKSYIAEGDIQ